MDNTTRSRVTRRFPDSKGVLTNRRQYKAQLAEAIGTSQAAVAAYETGAKAPELAKLPLIAKALGVTVAELFEEGQGSQQAAKVRVSPNRRAIKLQKAFEKLKPVEQQFVLKQIEGLIGQK